MKVLQVATLASSTGAYGGPVAVAQSQTKALRELAVDTVLVAGQRAADRPPSHEPWEQLVDVRRILPTPGFTSYFSWSLLVALWRGVGRSDVLHVQFGRELVPLFACLVAIVRRRPVVAQCHGMVVPSMSTPRKLLDAVVFAPVLRRVRCFLVYSEAERAGIASVTGRSICSHQLLNGADLPARWSDASPDISCTPWQVVFAARLHPRKRVGLFVDMAGQLAEELDVPVRFTVYGADEGDVEVVRQAAQAGVVSYLGAVPLGALRCVLESADIFVLPSVNEPFSVTILDAQARGCPVVVSDTNGFASHVEKWRSGTVFVSDDLHSLTGAVKAMIGDADQHRAMRRRARALVEQEFSWHAVAGDLSSYYDEAIGAAR